MGRRFAVRRVEEFILFDVVYEDGARSSDRKIPSSELGEVDGDLLAKTYIEARTGKLRRSPENSGPRSSP